MIISANSLLINGEIRSAIKFEVVDGMITSLNAEGVPDLEIAGTLIPGFVDMHCHGGGGNYFSAKSDQDIQKVIDIHRANGTTTTIASLVTEPLDVLKEQIKRLVPFVKSGKIAGIHLEGPYLSPGQCGAHDPELLRDPIVSELKELLEIGDGAISMITLAPELPHGIEAIEFLVDNGVVVALGHTDADAEVTKNALSAGASVITHFYNALPRIDHYNPGIVLVGLLNDSVVLELINDGHHVANAAVELVLKSAPGRMVLITDAMAAAGMEGSGEYKIGSLDVHVEDGVARLTSNGSLAGSTLTMKRTFERLIEEFGASIEYASYCASTLPARTLGIEYVGEIAVGKSANFVELDSSTGKVSNTYCF